ncbi:MAG: hypothetical protein HFJ27_02445 [Clostridia bacterium]|nr:hypothetical protein [Clostridia bacterium]
MKLSKEIENLGLPDYMKFGLELEVENLDFNKISKMNKELGWHSHKDNSLTDMGTECISPVLKENENKSVWKDVYDVCSNIEECSADGKRQPYTDHTCGGHVHFDAEIFNSNSEIMKNFLRVWAESEELVYKMCNAKNDPIRPGAMETSKITIKEICQTAFQSPLPNKENLPEKVTLKTIIGLARDTLKNIKNNVSNANGKVNIILADVLLGRKGMASPIGKKIKKQLDNGKLKLGKPKSALYRAIISKNKLDPSRYSSLNLSNLGIKNKNTIEFRLSNGTINPQTIKENVFLYASIIDTVVKITKEPEKMSEKLRKFYKRDISEEEKVDAFLGLIMNYQEDRQIYKDRWESVKNAAVFHETEGVKRFSESFKKEEFKREAYRQPHERISHAFNYISSLRNRTLQKNRGEKVNEY